MNLYETMFFVFYVKFYIRYMNSILILIATFLFTCLVFLVKYKYFWLPLGSCMQLITSIDTPLG